MKLKILVFIGGSYVSGLEIVTLHLIKGLIEEGNDVRCIISGWNDGVFKSKLQQLNVSYYEVKLGGIYLRKLGWTFDTLLNFPQAYTRCRSILNEFKPDICHFSNYGMFLMLYPLIRQKCVYNLQEPHKPTFKHQIIYKILNKKIEKFVGVSKYIVEVIERLGIPKNKIKLIYNGIPLIETSLEKGVPSFFEDKLIFAIIGQIAKWKGHTTLVNATERLINNGIDNFRIQVFGNDKNEYSKELHDLINKKRLNKYFEWKGFEINQDNIYRDCNIVVVPSLSEEPCSLTIIESMMRGKAVIASDRGGNPELIHHKQTGLIFRGADDLNLSLIMQELIENREYAYQFAKHAQEKAKNELTYKLMTKQYMQVYNDSIYNLSSL